MLILWGSGVHMVGREKGVISPPPPIWLINIIFMNISLVSLISKCIYFSQITKKSLVYRIQKIGIFVSGFIIHVVGLGWKMILRFIHESWLLFRYIRYNVPSYWKFPGMSLLWDIVVLYWYHLYINFLCDCTCVGILYWNQKYYSGTLYSRN